MRSLKSFALLLILSFLLPVQAQDPQDVVRVSTALVQVDVVVTKDGKQVTNLRPEDFEILEDGHRQQITNFSYVSVNPPSNNVTAAPFITTTQPSNPPPPPPPPQPRQVQRTIAIVVDDLGMSFQSMANLRIYLRKFMSESLRQNDLVAVIRTGGEVGALQQFTTDPRVLASAIADLKWNPCSRIGVSVLAPQRSVGLVTPPPESQMRGRASADRSPSSSQVDRPETANESNPCSVGSSVNYSISAIRFILRGMRELPGRKSMLIISDNLPMERQEDAPVDFGFKRPVRENAGLIDVWTQATSYADRLYGLAEQAIRSSVVIYGVSAMGLQTIGPQSADEISFPPQHMMRGASNEPNQLQKLITSRTSELQKNFDGTEWLAKETGGFAVRNQNDFALDRVMEDQNGYYLIGYRPATETFNRQFHTIQARLKRGGYTLRTRAGFYGVTEEPAAGPASDRDPLNKALVSPFGANDMSVRLTALFANDPSRGSLLRTFVAVDAKDLTFTEEVDGTRTAKFDLSTVLFSENGTVVNRQDQIATLRLRRGLYEQALGDGVIYGFDLPVKHAGAFQLRVALRDSGSQKIGAAGQFIQAPNLSDGQLALSDILLYADTANAETAGYELERGVVFRRFHQGASLVFGYTIYNASLDKKTQQPRLTTQTTVFRDSVKIYSSERAAVATNQTDLKRITTGARLQLGQALTPGEYVVQIVVEDQVAKRSAIRVTQFEVVK